MEILLGIVIGGLLLKGLPSVEIKLSNQIEEKEMKHKGVFESIGSAVTGIFK